MTGSSKDGFEGPKGPTFIHYVDTMRTFLNELQVQARKGPLSHRKIPQAGLFCMSGPVAHVDDEEDEDTVSKKSSNEEQLLPDNGESKPDEAGEKDMKVHKKLTTLVKTDKLRRWDSYKSIGHQDEMVKQTWADGCAYVGRWVLGEHSGRGKMTWPSGSSYEGELLNGSLHGVGTYHGVDGSVYKGSWEMNRKHGCGWKRYANGDIYEGRWKYDAPEGQGRYTWSNGSEYYGEWKNGLMSGRGILVWKNGDKYDGHWLNGLADGNGVYTWADGSAYFGIWHQGVNKGKGRFIRPRKENLESENLGYLHPFCIEEDEDVNADSESPERQKVCSDSHLSEELRPPGLGSRSNELVLGMVAVREGHCLVDKRPRELEDLTVSPQSTIDISKSNKCIYEDSDENFSYDESTTTSEADYTHNKWTKEEKKTPGETIDKGHRHYDLMTSLQLGIRSSVGRAMPGQKMRLGAADFGPKARTRMSFPREGSHVTPPHQSADFKWKDYCPKVFRWHLRELFKVDTAEYMLSICGDSGLRELSSPGKSGSVFYLTEDERFIIKTLRKSEVKVLLKMLPRYCNHVETYKNTLLTRFLGLHRFKNSHGQKVRFIIMGNVVSADFLIHKRFDLKGSSQGRSAEKEILNKSTTFKDLDLEFIFQLDKSWRDAVLDQISKDCKFLESEHIMDYSLLLGLHFKDSPKDTCDTDSSIADLPLHDVVLSRFLAESGGFIEVEVFSSQTALRKAEREEDKSILNGCSSLENSPERPRSFSVLFPENNGKTQIGYNMPAKAHRRLTSKKDDSNLKQAYDVLLYFGVIDILQEYDMGKKLEHAYKSFQFDSLSISAVDPILYSKRFQQFMHEIFQATE
ncbi:hypothetical protein KP509_33G037300 [Ceratopteris richardii]|uniref:1-phosphatidylinositol-4-phosphate 5-kinase n=1 Tax=Ceratopteris richardii TaxID=49495 RepID=A0A8T2QPY3_CERRI|nr:hypothetical protein KP509_33G037300 [Ceratopteris richardii]